MINSPTNKPPQTYAVANPSITVNLLSVPDQVQRFGIVQFIANHGEEVNMLRNPTAVIAIAPWRKISIDLRKLWIQLTRLEQHSCWHINLIHEPPQENRPQGFHLNHLQPNLDPTPITLAAIQLKPVTHTICTMELLSSTPYSILRSNIKLHNEDWHPRLNHASPTNISLTAANRLIPMMPATLLGDTKRSCSSFQHPQLHSSPDFRTKHNFLPDF